MVGRQEGGGDEADMAAALGEVRRWRGRPLFYYLFVFVRALQCDGRIQPPRGTACIVRLVLVELIWLCSLWRGLLWFVGGIQQSLCDEFMCASETETAMAATQHQQATHRCCHTDQRH